VSVAAVAALAVALVVWAPVPATGPSTDVTELTTDSTPNAGLAPGSAALRATINPETGGVEVSHTASYAPLDAETQNALRRDSEGLTQVFHPNGMVSSNLQGRFQSVSVARFDKDGKLIICSENADHIDGMHQERPGDQPATAEDLEVR
jgi:hypothetical protein